MPPELPARFRDYVAAFARNERDPFMRHYPGLPSTAFHDPSGFPIVRDLEARAAAILNEYRRLDGIDFHDEAEKVERRGRWTVRFLYERGRKDERTAELCPETTAIIERHRTVLGLGGLAYFSVLAPSTAVAPHRGPTNMRVRCHLGLEVPRDCGVRVNGEERSWEAGRCLVFDDSLVHEVWNHSNEPRAVLIVDLWHPDLSDAEVALLTGLERYAHANADGLLRYWQRNRAARTT